MIPHDPTEHVENMPGVGDLIGGRYRLESIIGQGALGTVMRAQHITMGREVAVKLLRPDISTHATIRRRLIQRVHQAQKLRHPNNCRLFDFGQAGGSLYLVMELLQGATLKTVIERGAPYPVGWVLDIGMQILDALGEAHDSDFIHRNLKPSKIFLLPRRRGGQQVKVMDYGLASSLDSLPRPNLDGGAVDGEADVDDGAEADREAEVCGTAAYLAPETLVQQTSGKPTDVYAVGLILIEMLTGKQVFSGDSLSQVLYRQIHTSVRLPPKLEWTSLGKVLMKSVSKHPGNRFGDADSFYEAIEQASETTASYFRLDARDLEDEDEPMSPQMLARMLKKQRGHGGSDRDDSDDDTDGDDAEPDPSSRNAAGASGAAPTRSSTAFPLVPPPTPISDRFSSGRGLHMSPGRLDTGDPDGGAAPSPGTRITHPLRDYADARSSRHVSFPRTDHPTGDETRGGDQRGDHQSEASGVGGDTAPAAATVRRVNLSQWFTRGTGGWASRLSVMFVALILSMAGLGLYLVLS